MKIIGLTGGIGSGKSTVARLLEERGAAVIDADKVGHDILGQPQMRRELVEAFGDGILGYDGEVDRARLGKVVFADPQALERLDRITHPRIRAVIDKLLEEYRRRGVEVVALEAALMVESGATSMVDEVWVTVAPEQAVLKRIKKRSGLSGEETRARIRAQASDDERARYADVIIRNDGSPEELRGEVERQWDRLVRGA